MKVIDWAILGGLEGVCLNLSKGAMSHSPFCAFFNFLKRSPEPTKGQWDSLSSNVAALKSKSPVRACTSMSPSVSEHTKQRKKTRSLSVVR